LLSPADIAAPSFADAALGDGSHLVRVAGRVLQAGRPGSVSAVLATLAETDARGNVSLLPDVHGAAQPGEETQHGASEFVLGEPVKGKDELAKIPPLETLLTASRPLSWVSRYKPPRWRTLLAFFSALASTRLRILGVALLLLGGVAVLGFELIWEHNWLASIFTAVSVVTGTGYGELLGSNVPTGMKFFGTGVMLLGLFVIAILIASVVDDFMSERRVQRLSVPMGKPTGHVITCGLGRVGVRVAERLLEVGVQVVAIEKDPNNPRLAIARTMGLPVVTGDATQEETLRAARVEHARCVLAVTSDDITNLETGLATRSMRAAMPVVLRLFDGDLARRVDRRLGLTISRSVSFAAAPVFAAAMLDRAVLAVIPYGPRVLLVAELPVDEGQELYGQPLSMLSRTGQLRVLAHQRGTVTAWAPPLTVVMATGDSVIVVATRDGLSAVLPQTTDLVPS
ncbi:MAG: potassium channel family protein, partial [Mycobacteriales bacterium]